MLTRVDAGKAWDATCRGKPMDDEEDIDAILTDSVMGIVVLGAIFGVGFVLGVAVGYFV